ARRTLVGRGSRPKPSRGDTRGVGRGSRWKATCADGFAQGRPPTDSQFRHRAGPNARSQNPIHIRSVADARALDPNQGNPAQPSCPAALNIAPDRRREREERRSPWARNGKNNGRRQSARVLVEVERSPPCVRKHGKPQESWN